MINAKLLETASALVNFFNQYPDAKDQGAQLEKQIGRCLATNWNNKQVDAELALVLDLYADLYASLYRERISSTKADTSTTKTNTTAAEISNDTTTQQTTTTRPRRGTAGQLPVRLQDYDMSDDESSVNSTLSEDNVDWAVPNDLYDIENDDFDVDYNSDDGTIDGDIMVDDMDMDTDISDDELDDLKNDNGDNTMVTEDTEPLTIDTNTTTAQPPKKKRGRPKGSTKKKKTNKQWRKKKKQKMKGPDVYVRKQRARRSRTRISNGSTNDVVEVDESIACEKLSLLEKRLPSINVVRAIQM